MKSEFHVVLESKKLDVVKKEGFLTPGASPRQQSPSPASGIVKPKQSQLPFGTKVPTIKPPKAKKKPGRKPLPTKPAEKITSAFVATKTPNATSKQSKQSAKVKSEESQPVNWVAQTMSMFPNLLKGPSNLPTGSTLGANVDDNRRIPPRKLKIGDSSSQNKPYRFDDHSQNQSAYGTSPLSERREYPQAPTTPTGDGRSSPTFTETISPKGTVPRDMARLLS